MTKKTKIIHFLTWITLLTGIIAFGHSIYQFPVSKIDVGLIAFVLVTAVSSSYLQIQFPRTKLYFTISDTLIFIALLTFGGEVGIVLATLESLYTSLNFKRKDIVIKTETLLLNCAIATITTFGTVYIARYIFGPIAAVAENGTLKNFVEMLCLMALSQFLLNSVFIAVFAAAKNNKSFWKIWYENCFNALVMFIAGASLAGLFFKAFQHIEPSLLLVTFGISAVVYMTYRRYATI